MTQSRRIAVTGGIGSGKSAFCDILRRKGYPVFSCDEISHSLWEEEGYRAELARLFPMCCRDGKIVKEELTACVFSDKMLLGRLNAFSHPRIMTRLFEKMKGLPVAFAEVPLLYEGGYETLFDGVIVLHRAEEKRIEAVCRRDGIPEEQVKRRIANQLGDFSAKIPCFRIENGKLSDLEAQAAAALSFFSLN